MAAFGFNGKWLGKGWRRFYFAACLFLIASLFYLGSQPFAVGLFRPPYDKIAHFAAFGGMALLLTLASVGRWPLAVVGAVTLVGVMDEWHQFYLPGRSPDIGDLATDVAAAAAVVVAVALLQRTASRGTN
jgi:lysylphosphatidylglycerol synthetase-like protein (DUF2156 family)